MPEDRRVNPRKPLRFVCDDANSPSGKGGTKWYYDDDVKRFKRYDEKGQYLSSISAKNLPDPEKMAFSRKRTLETLIKYVSAEKLEEIAGAAIAKGKDPEQEILSILEGRTAPAKAVQDMWNFKKGLENA